MSHRTESIWLSEVAGANEGEGDSLNLLEALPNDKEVEILIVGAGMTGTSVAYHLARAGVKCLVLEARQISGSATGRNAGMCWPNNERLEVDTASSVLKFIREYMSEEEALVNEAGGIRLVKSSDAPKTKDGDAVDISAVLPQLDPILSQEYVAYKDYSASFFPARVARALATEASKGGAEFMENVQVQAIEKMDGQFQRLKTSRGDIVAKKVVLATNAVIPELIPELASIVKPVTNTVLASKPLSEHLLPNVSGVSEGGGSAEVYMNVRRDRRLILGGKRCLVEAEETAAWKQELEKKTGKCPVSDEGAGDLRIVAALKEWLARVFPSIAEVVEFEYSWKGIIAVNTVDGMPLAGPMPQREGVFICGVFGGHGMPRCFSLGGAVARMVMGQEEPEEYVREYMHRCRVERLF